MTEFLKKYKKDIVKQLIYIGISLVFMFITLAFTNIKDYTYLPLKNKADIIEIQKEMKHKVNIEDFNLHKEVDKEIYRSINDKLDLLIELFKNK
jgi:hypothetical protein